MRLYLLPVSTRRTLLYAQRLDATTAHHPASLMDKGAAWAARTWSQWEKMEGGWQRKVVGYGNYAFRRIPFEEWGLKSVPPLSPRRREEEQQQQNNNQKKNSVQVVFPSGVIPEHKAGGVLTRLATERQALHRKRLMWCFVGMPIVAPFALVPVIPNLPFFYLAYRAWSHWRALSGGKHIQWLIQNNLLTFSPSKQLDELYAKHGGRTKSAPIENKEVDETASEEEGEEREEERVLITREQTSEISTMLDLPAVETELERAMWQVEREMKREMALKRGPQGKKRDSHE